MPFKETCHCGHDATTHYLDHDVKPIAERVSCLASGCDCKRYVNENDPKPKLRGERPKHAKWCQCSRCKEFDAPTDDAEPTTDRMWGGILIPP